MTEKEWIENCLSLRSRSWEQLMERTSLDNCPEPLKTKLQEFNIINSQYQKIMGEIDRYLITLGYEAG